MAHPNYANLKFPPYEYQEYPKFIRGPNGQEVLVHGAGDEIEATRHWGGEASTGNALTEQVRRHRRTKAEMEAARAAEQGTE
jgi:hypothetical protein